MCTFLLFVVCLFVVVVFFWGGGDIYVGMDRDLDIGAKVVCILLLGQSNSSDLE